MTVILMGSFNIKLCLARTLINGKYSTQCMQQNGHARAADRRRPRSPDAHRPHHGRSGRPRTTTTTAVRPTCDAGQMARAAAHHVGSVGQVRKNTVKYLQ